MLTFSQASELAEAWLRILHSQCAIVREATLKRPYGWVFFWQSRAYLETRDWKKMLGGNAPIIVDRVNGEVRVTGTALPLEKYLAEYEATLPPARLQLSLPEEP